MKHHPTVEKYLVSYQSSDLGSSTPIAKIDPDNNNQNQNKSTSTTHGTTPSKFISNLSPAHSVDQRSLTNIKNEPDNNNTNSNYTPNHNNKNSNTISSNPNRRSVSPNSDNVQSLLSPSKKSPISYDLVTGKPIKTSSSKKPKLLSPVKKSTFPPKRNNQNYNSDNSNSNGAIDLASEGSNNSNDINEEDHYSPSLFDEEPNFSNYSGDGNHQSIYLLYNIISYGSPFRTIPDTLFV